MELKFNHDALRNARIKRNIKQSDAAAQVGVAQGTYSGWEKDVCPPFDCAYALAKFYRIPLIRLLKGTHPKAS